MKRTTWPLARNLALTMRPPTLLIRTLNRRARLMATTFESDPRNHPPHHQDISKIQRGVAPISTTAVYAAATTQGPKEASRVSTGPKNILLRAHQQLELGYNPKPYGTPTDFLP